MTMLKSDRLKELSKNQEEIIDEFEKKQEIFYAEYYKKTNDNINYFVERMKIVNVEIVEIIVKNKVKKELNNNG